MGRKKSVSLSWSSLHTFVPESLAEQMLKEGDVGARDQLRKRLPHRGVLPQPGDTGLLPRTAPALGQF